MSDSHSQELRRQLQIIDEDEQLYREEVQRTLRNYHANLEKSRADLAELSQMQDPEMAASLQDALAELKKTERQFLEDVSEAQRTFCETMEQERVLIRNAL